MGKRYRIGELSQETGLTADTLRFYERRGLLDHPARTAGGYRIYDPSVIERIQFITRAQSLGFSLDEIHELIRFNGKGGLRRCARVRDFLRDRLGKLERMLADLDHLHETLHEALLQCERALDAADAQACPVVDLNAPMTRDARTRIGPRKRRLLDSGFDSKVHTSRKKVKVQ